VNTGSVYQALETIETSVPICLKWTTLHAVLGVLGIASATWRVDVCQTEVIKWNDAGDCQ